MRQFRADTLKNFFKCIYLFQRERKHEWGERTEARERSRLTTEHRAPIWGSIPRP